MDNETTIDPAALSGVAESITTEPVVEPAPPEAPVESQVPPDAPDVAVEPPAPVGPVTLPTEAETAAATLLRETRESVDVQEAAANVNADSIASHTIGLLHTDTIIERAADIDGAGPRWEQFHTSP